jgi:hypothetical protein
MIIATASSVAAIAGTSIAGTSIAGASIAGASSTGASSTGASSTGASSIGASSTGASIAGASSIGASSIGASGTRPSTTGTPAVYNDPEAILSSETGVTPPLDGPIKAALAGDRLTLDQIYTYNKLLASSGRISKSLIASLINQGQINSKAEASQGKPAEAANILGQVLDFSHYLSSLKWGQVPWNKQIPYCWLDSWKAPGVGLELADYIAALNDYGFFLQKSGRDEEAIPIFKAVINEDPTREVAYLNLADSLEKTGKSSDAGQYYRLYKQLMEQESKAILVPARVDVGRKKAITPEKINSDVLQYMDLVQDTIHKAWIPFKSNTSSKVVAQFHVDSEGHLKDVKIIKNSGNENTDRAATDALAKVNLPKQI